MQELYYPKFRISYAIFHCASTLTVP